jgi:ComF family protein
MPGPLPPHVASRLPQPRRPSWWPRGLGLGAFVPSWCEVCRGACDASADDGALCATCVARYAAPRARCRRCALPLGHAADACGDCLRDPPPYDRTVCAADYGFPWDRLLAGFKYQGRIELAPTLAARMVAALHAAGAVPGRVPPGDEPPVDRVQPVPLAPERLAERGYNQAWELARRIARRLRLEADATLLQRPVHTPQQVALGSAAERRRNLASAFMVDPRRRHVVAGRHVALVDDVMTTGATARAAAAVLKRAGAATVSVWLLARTPAPLAGDDAG